MGDRGGARDAVGEREEKKGTIEEEEEDGRQ